MNTKNSAISVIEGNLSLLSKDSVSAAERRSVQLRDLAVQLMRDPAILLGENRINEFEKMFVFQNPDADVPDEIKDYVIFENKAQVFSDKLTVCACLADEFSARGIDISAKLLGPATYTGPSKIAYFRNAYADAAFRIFSEVIEKPSVIYSSDFSSVCEEVYYGRADMCMLPLDSSRDAKLISFYRLTDKYELNPIYSCDVTTPDGSVTTRYALLKRGISVPNDSHLNMSGTCFFEFNLLLDSSPAFEDVLTAAKKFGLSLYKADSMPLTYSDSEFACDIIFKVGSAKGLNAFILYLSLAVPQYAPFGIYPHINTKK